MPSVLVLLFAFETGFHVVQASLEILILLPQTLSPFYFLALFIFMLIVIYAYYCK